MKVLAGFSNEVAILTTNKQVAVEAMARHRIAYVRLFDDEYAAYFAVSRGLVMTCGIGVPIPRLEDLRNYGYIEFKMNTNVSSGYRQRFFAIVSNVGSAVVTDLQFLFEFLCSYESTVLYLEIREFQTEVDANNWRNGMYLQFIAPFMAYFSTPYPIIGPVKENTTISVVDYKNFLKEQHPNIPQDIYAAYSLPGAEPVR